MKLGLPHFDLAEASPHDPSLLVRDESDRVGALFLSFACMMNDLKGMIWLDQVLLDNRPEEGSAAEVQGQWYGMHRQVAKYTLGVIHEFLVLVRKNRKVIAGAEVIDLVGQLPGHAQKKWRSVVEAANSGTSHQKPDLVSYLAQVRNNLSFHYYDPKRLTQGYLKHFGNESEDPTHQYAYVSLGATMAATRYYYADAAVQSAMDMIFRTPGAEDRIRAMIEDVNGAVSALLLAFVQQRTQETGAQ